MKTADVKKENVRTLEEARLNRTAREQIAVLNKKFGVGLGAKSERDRLHQLIQEGKGDIKKKDLIKPKKEVLNKLSKSNLKQVLTERDEKVIQAMQDEMEFDESKGN